MFDGVLSMQLFVITFISKKGVVGIVKVALRKTKLEFNSFPSILDIIAIIFRIYVPVIMFL